MAVRGRPRKRRVLTVVFDTNALFNKGYDVLMCPAASDLIGRHSVHGDLDVRWVIPDIVRGEREYQMRNEYRNISSHITRAERLFGGQWGITQDAVDRRIAERINDELAALHIEVVPCDAGRVDWGDMMRRACFREPPFERGQTEKGFRDAVVCETFIQLASDLVGGDAIVLVSNDQLIKEHIESRGVAGNRARVVDDLTALNDEIQLRVAHVDENTQALIEHRAQILFFDWDNRDDPSSLWARENLYDRIWREHGDKIKQAPSGVAHVTLEQELSNARLVSKVVNRVHFESVFSIQSAFRIWVPTPGVQQESTAMTLANLAVVDQAAVDHQLPKNTLSGLLGIQQPAGEWRQIKKPTRDMVSIRWSATFTRHRTLTRATIDSIDFVEPPTGALAFNRGVAGVSG
ncbi:PIN domain-containing protein [Burkholderia sp. 22088]|uniref:PIN domain-containing protein n=1 Tax=Burkholderia sp. 22088 TaxID=3453871 RepID=UPI003F86EAA6